MSGKNSFTTHTHRVTVGYLTRRQLVGFRVTLGFTTRCRMVGSGGIGNLDLTVFKRYQICLFWPDTINLTHLRRVRFQPDSTYRNCKGILTLSKFSNSTRLVQRTDVGSDFNLTLHVKIIKEFLTDLHFSTWHDWPAQLTVRFWPYIQEL